MIHIGIIREEKNPPDSRVPLTPEQCEALANGGEVQISVQSSEVRCFSDEAYLRRGIPVREDISDCDILLGVKEVPIDSLIPDKTYFFFSHTIKEQAYNRDLLRAILKKNINLIDYEALTDKHGHRLIAYGKYAGIVGAHNALYTYGERTDYFHLPRMKDCPDYAYAKAIYSDLRLPAMKIILTGHGRVGNGAATVLDDMMIKAVQPEDFLNMEYEQPVYTQLQTEDYTRHKDVEKAFDRSHFRAHPSAYESTFAPFAERGDIMINGIFWDNNAPQFFTLDDIRKPDFNLRVIADITCDIAPKSSIPTTIRASSIADPIYGFSRTTLEEVAPHSEKSIDVMAIDNLPNELPIDASQHFGEQFILHILPELGKMDSSPIIQGALVAENGNLGTHFTYLKNYVEGIPSPVA